MCHNSGTLTSIFKFKNQTITSCNKLFYKLLQPMKFHNSIEHPSRIKYISMRQRREKGIIPRWLYLLACMHFALQINAKDNSLAKYRIVTHSSSVDANRCGHLVVDGSLNTYWEAHYKDKEQWLLIDLGSSHVIKQATINWGENYALEYKVFLLSDDKTLKTQVFETSEGTSSTITFNIKDLNARYVKIEIQKVVQDIRGAIIKEVTVKGEGAERFRASYMSKITKDSLSLDGRNKWRVQNAMLLKDDFKAISTPNYDDSNWIPATVPGTVLADYYNFGALPDPLYGDNMHQISDAFFSGNDFWYRKDLDFSKELTDEKIFINFSGVNYHSDIYFNGKHLGKINGAFQRAEFEITELIKFSETNTLAVLVHHNPNWISGEFKVIRKTLGCRTTNGDMLGLDGPTCLASAGWNWLPIIKGRNNGIWNSVNVRVGHNVSINDPWVSAILPLPDTTKADLTIHAEIKNHSNTRISGKLLAEFNDIRIELPLLLDAEQLKTVTLDKHDFAQLSINNPKLWWPNGYGAQNLYDLKLQFVENKKVSDTEEIKFGIRHMEYKHHNGILFIYCNGYRIQLKGGNWGLPEALMRLDNYAYDLRVKLHAEANFNMIRNWLGMTNHKEFYEACDRHGILIFDDFWLANQKNGPDPLDMDLFMANAYDKIKWVRKHPSLAFYCGRNEGIPPVEYDRALKKATELLDGTRHYVTNSADGTLSGFGPYEVKSPEWYFDRRGETLHSEIGIIAIPEPESIRKMMPEQDIWPISDMWAIHDYQYDRSFKYTEMLYERYGEAKSMEEYSSKAQLQNFETGKAMFECLQSKQGSGMILWMSQSAWPSFICQLYDHYLEYTSSYFAVKKGSSPLHVFWDSKLDEIRVANNTKADLTDASVKATIYNAQGEELWTATEDINVNHSSVKTAFEIKQKAADEVLYLKLYLYKKDKVINDNFYWIENNKGNCLDLNKLAPTDIEVKIAEHKTTTHYTAQLKLKNESDNISLLNKIKLKDVLTGESILPVFYSDDYISLLPGESKTITIRVEKKYLENKHANLHLEGWNTNAKVLQLSKASYK